MTSRLVKRACSIMPLTELKLVTSFWLSIIFDGKDLAFFLCRYLCSLRSADVFLVVASLPPIILEGDKRRLEYICALQAITCAVCNFLSLRGEIIIAT